jgi:hypothetical protein
LSELGFSCYNLTLPINILNEGENHFVEMHSRPSTPTL